MSLELIIQIATLVSGIASLAGIAGLIATIVIYKRQMTAMMFLEYTKRYEEIVDSFPANAWAYRLNSAEDLPVTSPELTKSILKYLNICCEEYTLSQKGYLAKDIWSMWEGIVKRVLRSPLFRREWPTLAVEFESYPEFSKYVEAVQNNQK